MKPNLIATLCLLLCASLAACSDGADLCDAPPEGSFCADNDVQNLHLDVSISGGTRVVLEDPGLLIDSRCAVTWEGCQLVGSCTDSFAGCTDCPVTVDWVDEDTVQLFLDARTYDLDVEAQRCF